jgi:thymidylate synthase (FAD)
MSQLFSMGSDQRIVKAARVSFAKDLSSVIDVERDKKLIKYLLDNKHASPFEHVIFAFKTNKKEYINLISKISYPVVNIYYDGGYIWLNARTLINFIDQLPYKLVEYAQQIIPTTMSFVLDKSNINNYTIDKDQNNQIITTSSGWIKLLDKLELGTCLDHYTFIVECPLFVARQWFRHRFGSFNEVSRRYTDVDLDFYIPEKLRLQSKNNKQASDDNYLDNEQNTLLVSLLQISVKTMKVTYNLLRELDVAKEIARGVLPQFMKTRFYWTAPRISIDNFIKLRKHKHAQFEIREFAEAIEQIIGYKECYNLKL